MTPAEQALRELRRLARGRRESEIQSAVLAYLRARGCFAWRQNSGLMVVDGPTKPRAIRIGSKGMSDIAFVLPGGRAGFCEVKRPGQRPTPEQRAFLEVVRKQGAVGFVASSVEDAELVLNAVLLEATR